ncbi:Deoxyribonuclease, TatD [Metarhizium album ARSEF 1941]|uniref:Deoxyribonuclease, TatD n=1 Tax=Metarhizium album (strain ARSEF 1941) TaxID=1081103 RepID=A0A0B2WPF9_METAS|nr:Deoxyribonuclease, TatD [Metarhizium album ARSEF 1941]KHN97926.1 Deoxyribonuclease, TatD [Metarhizium album ARSEF 1941]
MRASALVIMATRSQDQDLVASVASTHGVQGRASLRGRRAGCQNDGHGDTEAAAAAVSSIPAVQEQRPAGQNSSCQVVPSFGWHPWFSHQLYDDVAAEPTYKPPRQTPTRDETDEAALLAAKKVHYQAVLTPPPQDDGFVASLPTPMPLSSFISSTRVRLQSFPLALVGEIGLDKAFRLPQKWDPASFESRDGTLTPGGREGRLLSRHRVRKPHQEAILLSQLRLAGEAGRPVSIHGLQAHGILYDVVSRCWKGHEKHIASRREKRMMAPGEQDDSDKEDANAVAGKPYPPRICLHSYSGSVEGLRQWFNPTVPATVYVSLSMAVNFGTASSREKFPEIVGAVPDDRILVESDLDSAGEKMDASLEDMYRRVCEVKGWSLEAGILRVAKNLEEFVLGHES